MEKKIKKLIEEYNGKILAAQSTAKENLAEKRKFRKLLKEFDQQPTPSVNSSWLDKDVLGYELKKSNLQSSYDKCCEIEKVLDAREMAYVQAKKDIESILEWNEEIASGEVTRLSADDVFAMAKNEGMNNQLEDLGVIVKPISFTFFKQGESDKKYKLTVSQLKDRYKTFLEDEEKDWVEIYNLKSSVLKFIGSHEGLNSSAVREEYDLIHEHLKDVRIDFLATIE